MWDMHMQVQRAGIIFSMSIHEVVQDFVQDFTFLINLISVRIEMFNTSTAIVDRKKLILSNEKLKIETGPLPKCCHRVLW